MNDADTLPSASLEFSNVTFRRGERHLFENLSLSLHHGQLLWITGANGIGKTSILKLAAGLWTPEVGEITYKQAGQTAAANDICAYLGHIDAFEPLLSANEALEFWAEIYNFDAPLVDVFETIGLTEQMDVRTSALSAGQKRRLAFGRLIIAQRPIWILDEPKAAMDKLGQSLIETLISEHLRRGGSALVATHDDTLSLGRRDRRIVLEAAS